MSEVGDRVHRLTTPDGAVAHHAIYCPGCDEVHAIDSRWTFNGDMVRPTFTPSLLCRQRVKDVERVCHSFITHGRIQYLGDCTHAMAGQTIDLPEFHWPE